MNRTNLCYLILLVIPFMLPTPKNNACNNYWSYFNIYFSENCYHNPDIYSNVTEIIQRHIGSLEEHQVQTDDGYSLQILRIPRRDPKGVILFIHPAFTDAEFWVTQFNESIAFMFWEAGYDVWLNNHRGDKFSQEHTKLADFWDYSFHEMGYYDLSTTIEYIHRETNGSKMICFGFSLGAAVSTVYASTRPEEAQKYVKMFVSVAPLTYLKTMPFRHFFFLAPLARFFGIQTFGGEVWYQDFLRGLFISVPFKKLVPYLISLTTGGSADEFDPNYVNVYLSQDGSSCSSKTMDHYFQIYKADGNFSMYDHGEEKNLMLYKSEKPPFYPMENIKVPFLLVYSKGDIISHFKDNEFLYEKLPDVGKAKGRIVVEGMNHLDLVYGKHRIERVYGKILEVLSGV